MMIKLEKYTPPCTSTGYGTIAPILGIVLALTFHFYPLFNDGYAILFNILAGFLTSFILLILPYNRASKILQKRLNEYINEYQSSLTNFERTELLECLVNIHIDVNTKAFIQNYIETNK